VLQNRVTANVTSGLQAVQGIPEMIKQKIIAGVAGGGLQMGMPKGVSSLPAAAAQAMETAFKTWFTNAIASTFVVAVVLAVIGGLCAFLLRSHVKDEQVSEAGAPTTPAAEIAIVDTAVTEVDAV